MVFSIKKGETPGVYINQTHGDEKPAIYIYIYICVCVLLYCHTLVEDALPMFLINVILLRGKSEGCCEGSGMVGV